MRAGLIALGMLIAGGAVASEDPKERSRTAAAFLLVLSYQCEPVLDEPDLIDRAIADTRLTLEAGGFSEGETNEFLQKFQEGIASGDVERNQAEGFCRAMLRNIMTNRENFRAELRG
jgi:hypothetical protein